MDAGFDSRHLQNFILRPIYLNSNFYIKIKGDIKLAICERCGKEHDGSFGSGRFCSKYCANVRSFPKEVRDKISKSHSKPVILEERICPKCGKSFLVNINGKRIKLYCSLSCANTHKHTQETKDKISKGMKRYLRSGGTFNTMTQNSNHFRPYASKHGTYKGIRCDSSYELAFVIYCLDHGISINRCSYGFMYDTSTSKDNKYIPDFQCGHKNIIEIKGRCGQKTWEKADSVPNKYHYCILFEKDLEKCFNHIQKTYGINKNKVYTLYED